MAGGANIRKRIIAGKARQARKRGVVFRTPARELDLYDILKLDIGKEAKKGLAKASTATKNRLARDWLLTKLRWQAGMLDHSISVSKLSYLIARELGVRGRDLSLAARAGLMHDVGKAYNKEMAKLIRAKRKLTPEELEITRKHAELGARLIESIEPEGVVKAVAEHQELFSGEGYPKGLKGEEISLFAGIVTVADHYFSSIEKRPYRPPLTKKQAIEYIRAESGKRLDPEIVKAFFRVVEKNPSMFR